MGTEKYVKGASSPTDRGETMGQKGAYWTAFAVGILMGSGRAFLAHMQKVYQQPAGAPHAAPAWYLVAATTLIAVLATHRSREYRCFYAVPVGLIVSSVVASLFP
jgi:hypothetical protein